MKHFLVILLFFVPAMMMAQGNFNVSAFRAQVNEMIPRKFPSSHPSFGYSVEVKNDSATIYLPYAGEAYWLTSLSTDGLSFKAPIKNFKSKRNKKGTSTDLSFSVRHANNDYKFSFSIYDGKRFHLTVMPGNAESCSYSGTWK